MVALAQTLVALGAAALAPLLVIAAASSSGPVTIPLISSTERTLAKRNNLLAPQGDILIPVHVGTPAQELHMYVSLGGAPIIAVSKNVSATANFTYDPDASTSRKPLGQTFTSVDDPDTAGAYAGSIVNETVEVAGVFLENQPIMVAEYDSAPVAPQAAKDAEAGKTGQLSLGLSNSGATADERSKATYMPWWMNLKPEATFGIRLTRPNALNNEFTWAGSPGQITFGGIDQSAISGQVQWINSVANDVYPEYWYVPLDGIKVDGQPTAKPYFTGGDDLLGNKVGGTGDAPQMQLSLKNEDIELPDTSFPELLRLIPGAQWHDPANKFMGIKVPCDTKTVISLSIGGTDWDLQPADWVQYPRPGSSANLPDCETYFSSIDASAVNSFALGHPFFTAHYVAFKYNPPQVGFARLSTPNPPPPGAPGADNVSDISSVTQGQAAANTASLPYGSPPNAAGTGAVAPVGPASGSQRRIIVGFPAVCAALVGLVAVITN